MSAAHDHEARALADARGIRSLQVHGHRDLGTLDAAPGQREQACTALATAIEMYRALATTF